MDNIITGKVTNIQNYKNPVKFDIRTTTNITYHIIYNGFCPIQKGDVMTFRLPELPSTNTINMDDNSLPLIQQGTDTDSIINYLNSQSKRLQISYNAISDIIKHITRKVGAENIASYLSVTSERYLELDSFGDVKGKLEIAVESGIVPTLLTEVYFKKLMQIWYKGQVLRKFYLLGLTNTEIKEMLEYGDGTLDDYYEILTKYPLTIYTIDTPENFLNPVNSKSMKILTRLQLRIDNHDYWCGVIVRDIFQICKKRSWMCVPVSIISAKYPFFASLLGNLQNNYGVVMDEKYNVLYLQFFHKVEAIVSDRLFLTSTKDPTQIVSEFNGNDDIDWVCKTLNPVQQQAVRSSLQNNLSIITGGAGTGKTTIIKEITHNLLLKSVPYHVCSFTGKAVSRIREVLKDSKPSTIHRMLSSKSIFRDAPFSHLIIDEASMVTTILLYRVFKLFNHDFRITFIGDINQLEPIGSGTLLKELFSVGSIPITKLLTNMRIQLSNGVQDGILVNAENIINTGANEEEEEMMMMIEEEYGSSAQIQHIVKLMPADNFVIYPSTNLDPVFAIYNHLLQQSVPANDIIVLTPYVKECTVINENLQRIYHKEKKLYLQDKNVKWFKDDKVVMKSNNYDINVMNGEEGIVHKVDLTKKEITVAFGNILAPFKVGGEGGMDNGMNTDVIEMNNTLVNPTDKNTTDHLRHSYCLTCHSAQGSEWKFAIIYLPHGNKANEWFVNKNMCYTMITRGKCCIWIIGDVSGFEAACSRPTKSRIEYLGCRINSLEA
ncbi:exonuclease V [Orpheovirus IHUMI-LCC2]|uniref:ATP-dependent RecD-like DNA helicase n=1 Tax=Orpheovirus IHUMI-LCC2 TaxID=2023057 RepID=A0A2I2L5Q3_9VIRU|nr:exonuclease V [Orpheovirus IHUMI-LCC2]SNW62863.1 ATP-dependent RecD-like DNA helicase [Orpheovirus IHUMI-LCC2]